MPRDRRRPPAHPAGDRTGGAEEGERTPIPRAAPGDREGLADLNEKFSQPGPLGGDAAIHGWEIKEKIEKAHRPGQRRAVGDLNRPRRSSSASSRLRRSRRRPTPRWPSCRRQKFLKEEVDAEDIAEVVAWTHIPVSA
jgi:ATP-dependent Clp protease ATP-binding subunit ClpB